MSIFGKLLKTAVDVATLPASVALDVLTMGGEMTDRNEPYTQQHLRAVGKDISKVSDELDKL